MSGIGCKMDWKLKIIDNSSFIILIFVFLYFTSSLRAGLKEINISLREINIELRKISLTVERSFSWEARQEVSAIKSLLTKYLEAKIKKEQKIINN